MKRQPNFEQFLRVLLKHEEPDWVPIAEFGIDWRIMEPILEPPAGSDSDSVMAWSVKCWQEISCDYVRAWADIGFPRESLLAADTAAGFQGDRGWVDESKGPITTWEEFERYSWPEVTPETFASVEALARHLPEGMKRVCSSYLVIHAYWRCIQESNLECGGHRRRFALDDNLLQRANLTTGGPSRL